MPKIISKNFLNSKCKKGNLNELDKINNQIVKKEIYKITLLFLEPVYDFFNNQKNVNLKEFKNFVFE